MIRSRDPISPPRAAYTKRLFLNIMRRHTNMIPISYLMTILQTVFEIRYTHFSDIYF